MQVYRDIDAHLSVLENRRIAVVGYGNQGRAQALNLRDSGLDVVIGNREDSYAQQARSDGFEVVAIGQAVAQASVVFMLIPDEVAPDLFQQEIAPRLTEGSALVFATGYNIAFGAIAPPPGLDVVLVAPRMLGSGVRDLYEAGHGFPAFIGVAQDHTGQAHAIALALAKGIGATRTGVIETTFAQEAELDLFTEQCFGPAFGQVLLTAIDLLIEEGYPPEAVLLELYMSGEFAYTLRKIAELGTVAQTQLHSHTSQYGSMSRGLRFRLPDLRARMKKGLDEIQSGEFAREWAAEQAEGCPTLALLQDQARELPLHQLEQDLRQALGDAPHPELVAMPKSALPTPAAPDAQEAPDRSVWGIVSRLVARVRALFASPQREVAAVTFDSAPSQAEMEQVLRIFTASASRDTVLQAFAAGRQLSTHYVLGDYHLEFHLCFQDGAVVAGLGAPATPAQVRLDTDADTLDGMFTGRINGARAAMSGKITFSGDTRLALGIQRVQSDLNRLYRAAREQARR